MNEFLKEKLTDYFVFPKKNGLVNDNHLIYSYMGLTAMSRFISSSNDFEDNYYYNHIELVKIGKTVLNSEWNSEKDTADNDEVKKEMTLSIEKFLSRFGHINDISLSTNSNYKNYITNNTKYKYKDISFQMGLPSDLKNKKLSGFTFLMDFNEEYETYELKYAISVELLLASLEESFISIEDGSIEVLSLNENKNYYDSWLNISQLKINQMTVGRKLENNHYVYYVIRKNKNGIIGKRFEEKKFLSNNLEIKRIIFYLRSINNNPLVAIIKDYDDNFIELFLPTECPKYESTILMNIGYPEPYFKKRNHFIIRKEFEALVNDLLTNVYLKVERK